MRCSTCKAQARPRYRQCERCAERARRRERARWANSKRACCDCGRVKERPKLDACDRCLHLDGRTSTEQALIAILREVVEATPDTLAAELGVTRPTVTGTLYQMRRRGRAERRIAGDPESPWQGVAVWHLVDRQGVAA